MLLSAGMEGNGTGRRVGSVHISCDFNVSLLGEHPVEPEREGEREETVCHHVARGRSDCRDAVIGLRNKPPLSPASVALSFPPPLSRYTSPFPTPPLPPCVDAPYPHRALNDGYYFAVASLLYPS